MTVEPISAAEAADISSSATGRGPLPDDGAALLDRFPFKHGIYRLVRRNRLLRAIKYGWRVVSSREDGRLLMWFDRGLR